MKLSKKTVFGLILTVCFYVPSKVGYAQDDKLIDKVAGRMDLEFQQMTEQDALGDIHTLRQFIADSLRLVYDESFQQKLDSLESACTDKTENLQAERDRLATLNRTLSDSIENMANRPTNAPGLNTRLEEKYFRYEKVLKMDTPKRKTGFLKMASSVENISPFQIDELNTYFDKYFPAARTDSVLDFIIQINIRDGDWSNAERNIIKFLYLFPESSLYEEMKSIRGGIFQTEKYYKTYNVFLSDLLNAVPKLPRGDMRYFRYIELLKDLPDPNVRGAFVAEARKFLALYPASKYAPETNLWLANTLLNSNQPHSAYLLLQKMMILYAEDALYCGALHISGVIQQEQFNEYENAIKTFAALIQRFPDDTLAEDAQHRIAKINDENLNDWEKAVKEYQIYADKYSQSPAAIPALTRKATIQATRMSLIEEAVNTYKLIDERYPATTGAQEALTAAADLYFLKTRYDQAIEVYMSIFQKYPQSEKAVSALEQVVNIYQSKIKDNQKSIEILNLIITNYPDSKASARATKLLTKLEKVK